MPVFGPGTTSLGLRAFGNVYKHGRKVFKKFINNGENSVKANPKNRDLAWFEAETVKAEKLNVSPATKLHETHLARFITRYASGTFAAQLRRNAALKFQDLYHSSSVTLLGRLWWNVGRRSPLLSLVGFGLTAGTTKDVSDTGFHNVCNHIKELFTENSRQDSCEEVLDLQEGHIYRYKIGNMIAKGCNSAVYNAKNTEEEEYEHLEIAEESCVEEEESLEGLADKEQSDEESDFSIISEEEFEDFDMLRELDEDVDGNLTGSDITVLEDENTDASDIADHDLYSHLDEDLSLDTNYDLAVKMMFNYEAESTACAIIRSMENEIVPARVNAEPVINQWMNGHHVKKKRLPPHPNIVDIRDVFVDEIPILQDAYSEYPDALPERLNPDGFGRNSTLFLVMQKYECTLAEYLHQYTPTVDEGVFLLSQLLEALVHLNKHQIAHRDLKSDNILLRNIEGSMHLVLSDFGCCLADVDHGLRLPYTSDHVSKGGNTCLMAPEILSTQSGPGATLDYTKADLWAAGAIAYEIFGAQNPFYRGADGKRLNAATYTDDDLPDLPGFVPAKIQALVKSMLAREGKNRPDAVTVANCLQLLQLGATDWDLLNSSVLPVHHEVMRWLLTLSATALLEKSLPTPPLVVRHELMCQFLARVEFMTVMQSLEFFQTIM